MYVYKNYSNQNIKNLNNSPHTQYFDKINKNQIFIKVNTNKSLNTEKVKINFKIGKIKRELYLKKIVKNLKK